MKLRDLWRPALRVAISLLCAGGFYIAWMAAYLQVVKWGNSIAEGILWVLAPIVTAMGYTVGLIGSERMTAVKGRAFLRTLAWPLIGCVFGAAVVYWFGPMLIVFGMFVAGTASIVLREALQLRAGRRA